MLFQGSLELRRKHLAVRGTVGVLPQQFTQVAPAQDEDLRLILGGLSAVLYPLAKSGRSPEPYLAAGVGGQKATGGMTNTGFYLSGMAGIRVPLLAPIALDGGVQVLRLKYTQIELTAPPGGIQQDVRINPVAVFLGAHIGG